MVQFVRRYYDIFWVIILREWIIVWKEFNTVWFTIAPCFSNVYTMAHIVLHRRTEIASFHSMCYPSSSHCWFIMDNYLCTWRGQRSGIVVEFSMDLGSKLIVLFSCAIVYTLLKQEGRVIQNVLIFFHVILLSLTIIPQKISSSQRRNWPMPYRTQHPKRHFLTSETPKW